MPTNSSQHWQNDPNDSIRAEVGNRLPEQFPIPPPVGKKGVGNFALFCKDTRKRDYLK